MSLRSESGGCNASGTGAALTANLPFPTYDLKINGASHCDPESPTDITCQLACGQGSVEAAGLYRRLMYLFFKQAFNSESRESGEDSLEGAIQKMQASELLEVYLTPKD
jgi:hypothetical protein